CCHSSPRAFFPFLPRRPPTSTLFPYTTLFRSLVGWITLHRSTVRALRPALQPHGGAHQALFLLFDFSQVVANAVDMVAGRALGLVRQALGDRMEQPRVLTVDLTLLHRAVIKVVHRRK